MITFEKVIIFCYRGIHSTCSCKQIQFQQISFKKTSMSNDINGHIFMVLKNMINYQVSLHPCETTTLDKFNKLNYQLIIQMKNNHRYAQFALRINTLIKNVFTKKLTLVNNNTSSISNHHHHVIV